MEFGVHQASDTLARLAGLRTHKEDKPPFHRRPRNGFNRITFRHRERASLIK